MIVYRVDLRDVREMDLVSCDRNERSSLFVVSHVGGLTVNLHTHSSYECETVATAAGHLCYCLTLAYKSCPRL